MRRGKREESCRESGQREEAAAARWRTVEWSCVKRGRWRTAVHSGSGNTGSTAMHTYGSKVEMLQSFFQFKDGKLNEARHESWLGQDPGGELSIAATKPASRRHISKLLLIQRRLRNLVVLHSVSLYIDFKIEELY